MSLSLNDLVANLDTCKIHQQDRELDIGAIDLRSASDVQGCHTVDIVDDPLAYTAEVDHAGRKIECGHPVYLLALLGP